MTSYRCEKCKDTGWYRYDRNHSKVCEFCCKHQDGWWQVAEGYTGYDKALDNACCKAGCGTMMRDLK